MSKRKSRTKSLVVNKLDMVFEDDSSDPDIDLLTKPREAHLTSSMFTKATGSRQSARGKREKKIYDPSDHDKPVHKKKKEAIEAQQSALKKTPSKIQAKTPVKTPAKAESIIPVKLLKPVIQSAKRKLDLDKEIAEIQLETIQQKIAPPVPVAKEPSKRIQSRKKSVEKLAAEVVAVSSLVSSSSSVEIQPPPLRGILRKSISLDCRSILTSSTASVRDSAVTDITKWSSKDVAAYFCREGFDKKDATKFEDQEIDGETLLILQRSDLTNLNLKVGVFVKMWNRILRFQSGILTKILKVSRV